MVFDSSDGRAGFGLPGGVLFFLSRRGTVTGRALAMTSGPADRPHWGRPRGNRSRSP